MEIKLHNVPAGFDSKLMSESFSRNKDALRHLALMRNIPNGSREQDHLNPTFTWVERVCHKHRKTELHCAVRKGSEYQPEYQFYRHAPSFTYRTTFNDFEQAIVEHYLRHHAIRKNADGAFHWVGSEGGWPLFILEKKLSALEESYRDAARRTCDPMAIYKIQKIKLLRNMRTVNVWRLGVPSTGVDLHCTPLQAVIFKHILGGYNDTH